MPPCLSLPGRRVSNFFLLGQTLVLTLDSGLEFMVHGVVPVARYLICSISICTCTSIFLRSHPTILQSGPTI